MSFEERNLVAVMIALLLLSVCVLLFSASLEYRRLRKRLPLVLWCLGIVPGFCGVIWGFWVFVTTMTTQAILPAFLLLEIGSGSLLRAAKKIEEQT